MKKHKICPTCSSKMIEYTFSFNKGLATFLAKLYERNRPSKTDSLGLSYAQRTNSQKLRYWGLAVPHLTSESKIKKGWVITDKGRDFVEGKIPIHHKVVMYRNNFVRYDGDLIFFSQVSDGYKYNADYKQQVLDQLKF